SSARMTEAPLEPQPTKARSTLLGTLLKAAGAIAVSVLALWWALRDVDLGYVWSNLTRTSAAVIGLYLFIQVVIQVSRTVRYSLLVASLGHPSGRSVFA